MPANSCGKAPRVVKSVDVRALPIGPEEAFVLSCVNGLSSEDDIASATGFESEAISRIINRLAELGAIEFEPLSLAKEVQRQARTPTNSSGEFRIGPILEIREPGGSRHPGAVEGSESGEFTVRSDTSSSSHPNPIFPEDLAARRRALARKLGHSSAPPTKNAAASSPPESAQDFAAQELKRQELVTRARQRQLDHYSIDG